MNGYHGQALGTLTGDQGRQGPEYLQFTFPQIGRLGMVWLTQFSGYQDFVSFFHFISVSSYITKNFKFQSITCISEKLRRNWHDFWELLVLKQLSHWGDLIPQISTLDTPED